MTNATHGCSTSNAPDPADAVGERLDSARRDFGALDDDRLASILDDLVDRVNGHHVAIAHDAAVVDKDD